MTSSADLSGNFGCGSTGMPRPLSVTVRKPSGVELDLDAGGVAGDRLVHGVVEHLGEEMVQRLLVGAADIHAGPAADRLQPLQHLDVGGVVAGLARRPEEGRTAAGRRASAPAAEPRPCGRAARRRRRGRRRSSGAFRRLIRSCVHWLSWRRYRRTKWKRELPTRYAPASEPDVAGESLSGGNRRLRGRPIMAEPARRKPPADQCTGTARSECPHADGARAER